MKALLQHVWPSFQLDELGKIDAKINDGGARSWRTLLHAALSDGAVWSGGKKYYKVKILGGIWGAIISHIFAF